MKTILFCAIYLFTFFNSSFAQQLVNNDRQLFEKLDNLFSSQFNSSGIGCVTLISRHGQIIYKKASGMANIEMNVPMSTENILRVGSITKQFTAVSILQLVEKGLISLKDDITKFLPAYPTHGYTITIENLLSHTSGIKDYTEIKGLDIKKSPYSALELIDLFKDQPMDFPPGTKYQYSNSGYIILGYIIEKISGVSYEQYLSSNIFKPSGMDFSFFDNSSSIIKNRVPGYKFSEGVIMNADFFNASSAFSAGALVMSVEDFFRWHQAL
jgi:CubicO group peptidase (beta-lactamase class C family)